MTYTLRNRAEEVVRKALLVLISACLLVTAVYADTAEEEINHLISAVAESGCTFVRNGNNYSAQEAEEHLQLKYRRGRKHAKTAEQFISRLASESSMSGKPYYMNCEGVPSQTSGDWLAQRLELIRNGQKSAG